MAQPQTLNRVMAPSDRLVVSCRRPACGARFIATRDQAVRRYGPDATSYLIEKASRCPACGGTDISVAVAGFYDPASAPGRDEITFADVQRLGLSLSGTCAPCRHALTPTARGNTSASTATGNSDDPARPHQPPPCACHPGPPN